MTICLFCSTIGAENVFRDVKLFKKYCWKGLIQGIHPLISSTYPRIDQRQSDGHVWMIATFSYSTHVTQISNTSSITFPFRWLLNLHYSDVTWTSWYLKSTATPLFVEQFLQAYIKENIKAPRSLFCGESTGDRWIPLIYKGRQAIIWTNNGSSYRHLKCVTRPQWDKAAFGRINCAVTTPDMPITENNKIHNALMTSSNEKQFRVTGHLCGEFTGPRWISRTKASDAGLWCFLWSASE